MRSSLLFDHHFLKELNVLDWGYSEEPIPVSISHYEAWINKNLNDPLKYLADHRKDLRRDLRHIFPEFQSALVFLFSYQSVKKWMLENNRHEVAAYSLGFEGEDYHRALKFRLEKLVKSLNRPDMKYFFSLDAQPVLERDLAYRAGLGWFGKNSMLINKKEGSYFIIGSVLLSEKLPIEPPVMDVDHCGHCTACADACPTKAIDTETRTLIANKCISTYTIEVFKETSPPEGYDKSRGEIFGCDICQDVCPWNNKPLSRIASEFKLKDPFLHLKEWIYEWPREKLKTFIESETNRSLKRKFLGTPFDRPGKEGWMKNLKTYFQPK